MSDFNDDLAGKFYDVFNRLVRRTLDQKEVDMLHSTSNALAKVIRGQAERTALERCKKLNDATSAGFESVFEDIKSMRSELAATQEVITSTHNALRELIDSFKAPLSLAEHDEDLNEVEPDGE